MSDKKDEAVEVTVQIPLNVLLNEDPETLRGFLGENVYRRALLKVEPSDEPLEADLGGA